MFGRSNFSITLFYFVLVAAGKGAEFNEPVKATDSNQPTRHLFAAVKAGDIEQVKTQLANGADVNTRDESGRLPLHYVVAGKHKATVEILIAKGVQPDTFEGKELAKVKRLLSQGMDVNAKGIDDNTLLHYAAQPGYAYVAAYLIVHGGNVDALNGSNRTPVQYAMQWKQPTIALLLLDAGAVAPEGYKSVIISQAAQQVGQYDSQRAEPGDHVGTAQSSVERSVVGEPRENHDIAVLEISVANTCIREDVVPITVTIENRGSQGESFKALLLDDITPVSTQSVTLARSYQGGVQNTADIVFAPETLTRANFGNRVCIGGDVNGDGTLDVLVGAFRWQNERGRAYLYFGGANMNAAADVIFSGGNEGDGFANQSGAFGDVNNDGYDDLIIGASGSPGSPDRRRDGYVHVYHGGAVMDNVPDVILKPDTGGRLRFGFMVSCGDVDKDGYCDVLVPELGRECVYLFWGGNPMSTDTQIVFQGRDTGKYFGHRTAIGGDVNGDGYNDILIGARAAGGGQRGQAYLYFGNTKDKMDTEYDWLFTGETQGDNLGSAVDIFDIDDDGY